MKINTISTLMLALFPGFAFADLVDFGTTTKANKEGGFVVTGVFQATPAAKLGLAEGDVITKLDGNKLNATTSLARLIAGVREADSEVAINWLRGDTAMTGKVTLDRTLSEEAFADRYPNKPTVKKLSPEEEMEMLFSDDINDVEIDALDDLKEMGVDVESLQVQIQKALEDSAQGLFSGSPSASFSFSTMTTSSDGDSITVKGADGDKRHVIIKSKDGEVIFDDKITKDELEKVPEGNRKQVKNLMSGNFGVTIKDATTRTRGAGSIGGIGGPSDVEESAVDLLKKLEKEKEGDEKGEDK